MVQLLGFFLSNSYPDLKFNPTKQPASCESAFRNLSLSNHWLISKIITYFRSINLAFAIATPRKPWSFVTSLTFTVGAIDRSLVSLVMFSLMSALLLTRSTTPFVSVAYLSFGLSEKLLEWLAFYLCYRSSLVVYCFTKSLWTPVRFGLSQVSVSPQCRPRRPFFRLHAPLLYSSAPSL